MKESLFEEQILNHFQGASNAPSSVNMSHANHVVITKMLHKLVYGSEFRDRFLKVTYDDKSQSQDFPVGCLENLDLALPSNYEPQLKLGAMSYRHPELDFLVDLYIIRNFQLSGTDLTAAEEEEVAYAQSLRLFTSPALRDGGILQVYHTGLQPMIIGIYRAVVQAIKLRVEHDLARNLIVIPMIFNPRNRSVIGSADTSRTLNENSLGAIASDYTTLRHWC